MLLYQCEKCKNMINLINNGGGELVCCNEHMRELIPNSADASSEKHVPFVYTTGGEIIAQIGSETHPMDENHYIEWIVFDDGQKLQKFTFRPNETPQAKIAKEEKCTIYSYCNLHGLWKTNFS